jgi:hypothetical protein
MDLAKQQRGPIGHDPAMETGRPPAMAMAKDAVKARRQATVVAAVGAVVPTVLAAQGMASLAVDVLGFPIVAAVALASFLELALVASALLARAAALAGRPGGADAVAVWVVSATSGLLAGVHELTTTAPDGTTTWSADPGSGLAAAVRFFAPLVAAWLWERVLKAARAEQAERTLAEVRRDRRFLAVARAALAVRRLGEYGAGSRRHRLAQLRMERAHVAALRVAPPNPQLSDVLAAVGEVDHLPDATSVPHLTWRPAQHDTRAVEPLVVLVEAAERTAAFDPAGLGFPRVRALDEVPAEVEAPAGIVEVEESAPAVVALPVLDVAASLVEAPVEPVRATTAAAVAKPSKIRVRATAADGPGGARRSSGPSRTRTMAPKVWEMHDGGATQAEICEATGLGKGTVHRILHNSQRPVPAGV